MLRRRFVVFGYLARPGLAPLTMSVPLLGAYSSGRNLTSWQVVGLLMIGFCAHVYGFVLNDIVDLAIDRHVPERQHTPLITGHVQPGQALVLVLLVIPVSLCTYYFVLEGRIAGALLIGLSIVLSTVYNLQSKRGFLLRLVPELCLALSIGALSIVGAIFQNNGLPAVSIVFSTTLAAILLLLNSVPSGLKDIKTDSEADARSFVIASGCSIEADDHVHISPVVKIYSGTLQLLLILGLIILLIKTNARLWQHVAVGGFALLGGLHLRLLLTMPTAAQVRKVRPLLSGFYNYIALSMSLWAVFPLEVRALCGLFAIVLLLIPLQTGIRVWKARYQIIS